MKAAVRALNKAVSGAKTVGATKSAVKSTPASFSTLKEALPTKRVLSRLLFDANARYNYSRYLPALEAVYEGKDAPTKFTGNDLLLFQRVLAQVRAQTHTTNPRLVLLENRLVEAAAERGSKDALTTLAFMALDDTAGEFTADDRTAARGFLKKLVEMDHPLVFKMAGDREIVGIGFGAGAATSNGAEATADEVNGEESVIMNVTTENDVANSPDEDTTASGTGKGAPLEAEGEAVSKAALSATVTASPPLPTEDPPLPTNTSASHLSRAIALYTHFLELDPQSILAGAAHRALGLIHFRLQNLTQAHDHFERAVHLAPESDNARAHYFLGLLNEHDALLSRHHFQLAAGEGFRESFPALGYLELNVFGDLFKAREWFKLGAELGVEECIVGLFDVANREKDAVAAFKVLARADKMGVGRLLRKVRSENVKKVERAQREKVSKV